jgi:hypothetical protein
VGGAGGLTFVRRQTLIELIAHGVCIDFLVAVGIRFKARPGWSGSAKPHLITDNTDIRNGPFPKTARLRIRW